jgi:hypothetical protein
MLWHASHFVIGRRATNESLVACAGLLEKWKSNVLTTVTSSLMEVGHSGSVRLHPLNGLLTL